jgi:hypothetical protein
LYGLSSPANITLFEQHQQPVRHQGIIAVAIIAAVHLLLTALITALFLSQTRSTMLGQTWSAISQLYSEETQRLLEVSSACTDDEVKEWVIENGLVNNIVKLKRGRDIKGAVSWKSEDSRSQI